MGNVIPAMFLGHYLLNFTFWHSFYIFVSNSHAFCLTDNDV